MRLRDGLAWLVVWARLSVRIACAAPRALGAAPEICGGKAVGQLVVDGPGGLVGAVVSRSAVASRGYTGVRDAVVVGLAGEDGLVDGGLAGPRARRLAAVPEPDAISTRTSGGFPEMGTVSTCQIPRPLRRRGEGRPRARRGEDVRYAFWVGPGALACEVATTAERWLPKRPGPRPFYTKSTPRSGWIVSNMATALTGWSSKMSLSPCVADGLGYTGW